MALCMLLCCFTLHGVSSHSPRRIDSHSTEFCLTLHGVLSHSSWSLVLLFMESCLTLHGALVYTPRSIGLRSTEHRLTLHGVSAYAPRSIGLSSTEHRAWQKSRRDERTQTGVQTPVNVAAKEKALKGRQKQKQPVIKQVTYSVSPLGLTIVRLTCPGG